MSRNNKKKVAQSKRKKSLRTRIREAASDPDKRNRLIDIARKNTVNTRSFWHKQSFGAASPVRHIDPSEYKFDDKDKQD